MKQTWRWFGPNDPISLEMVRQTGAEGIVTALHDVPAGEVWSPDDILSLKAQIEQAGLSWDVCESIWMHDDIKLHGGGARKQLDAWKDTLANLGRAGIRTVCYNLLIGREPISHLTCRVEVWLCASK